MSYLPEDSDTRQFLLTQLVKDLSWPTYITPDNLDTSKIRQLLVALACPPVCAGVVEGEDWHTLCELKADRALELLGLPAYKESDPTDHWSI